MIGIQHQQQTNRTFIMWIAAGAALSAAAAYVLVGLHVLAVGDLAASEGPPLIAYVSAGFYTLGGLLILFLSRPLLIFGAVMNAMVMFFFFMAYSERPSVMFSPGGLTIKAVQILLEIALIYIIVTDSRRSQVSPIASQLMRK